MLPLVLATWPLAIAGVGALVYALKLAKLGRILLICAACFAAAALAGQVLSLDGMR